MEFTVTAQSYLSALEVLLKDGFRFLYLLLRGLDPIPMPMDLAIQNAKAHCLLGAPRAPSSVEVDVLLDLALLCVTNPAFPQGIILLAAKADPPPLPDGVDLRLFIHSLYPDAETQTRSLARAQTREIA